MAEEKLKFASENLAPISAKKLTNWKNEPSAKKLKEDLEASKTAHDSHVQKVKRWNDLLTVKGSSTPPKVKGRSQIQPKLIRRQAEWRYSALTEPFLGSEKMYSIKPATHEDVEGAIQNELVINWQFRTKINRVSFIDNYVRGAVDEGSVIVRVGWCRVTEDVEEEVPIWTYMAIEDQQSIEMLQAAAELKTENPRQFEEESTPELVAAVEYFEETEQPNVAMQIGTQIVTTEKIIYNHPTIDVINPENFYVDPSCGDDLNKAGFCVISFETSKAELLKEPKRYKNLDSVNWESATIVVANDHATKTPDNFNFKDTLRKRVVAYEYWGMWDIDGDDSLVPIVATWIGDVLIRLEENPFPDGKPPFVVEPYMPIKRELMGEPDSELLEDNQKILGAISRGMIDLLGRSANSQQGFAKNMLDTVNRRRYENGQDYEFNPNMPPSQGIIEHKYPEIPQSAMLMLQLQNAEAEALTGVKAFSGGISGDAYGEVAAGIRGVLDAASKREMAILRRLADGMVKIGKKILAMNAVFLSEEETIRVTNTEFIEVKREDLVGDFDLEVDISTAEVDNSKAQDLAFLLQTMGNTMDFSITQMILSEIARLKRMPALSHAIANFKPPPPDPIAQKKEELELKKLEMEIKKTEAEIGELDSQIALNKAKAQQALMDAEKTDLDITEQETGTSHERDMEKQKAQAQGNQQLEITKGLLKPKKLGEGIPDIDAAIGWNAVSSNVGKKERPYVPINRGQKSPPLPTAPVAPALPIAPENNPALNIGSQEYDPSQDPALNPALNF